MQSVDTASTWCVSVYRDPLSWIAYYIGNGCAGHPVQHVGNATIERCYHVWVSELTGRGLRPIVETVWCRDESEAELVAAALARTFALTAGGARS